jgi:hypothetical protein
MRYEKKYTFSIKDLETIRDDFKISKLGFSTAHPTRYNHSIYFDSFNYDDAMDNISGLSKRYKVRLRWYSDLKNFSINKETKFQLEIKLKRNALGEKIVHPINLSKEILTGNEISLINFITKQLPPEHKPYLSHCTNLSLGVFYKREYLVSKGIDMRATIDTKITYWNPDKIYLGKKYFNKIYETEYGVVEIKYPEDTYSSIKIEDLSLISNKITPARHSKYVVGSTLINK